MPAGRPIDEIYALCCPFTGEVRYIGKAVSAQRRFKSHMRDARRRTTPVYCWIRSLVKIGQLPKLVVLASTWEWRATEVEVIQQYRDGGSSLLNLADGGDEPSCPTHVRATNGHANAIRLHSDPNAKRIWTLKQKMGVLLREGCVQERTKDKLRLAAKLRPDLFGQWSSL